MPHIPWHDRRKNVPESHCQLGVNARLSPNVLGCPLNLTRVEVDLTLDHAESAVWCRATTEVHSKTGVEMEALCAVQVALLTIYDMCKAVDRGMVIDQVCLVEKQGGRSGSWQRAMD